MGGYYTQKRTYPKDHVISYKRYNQNPVGPVRSLLWSPLQTTTSYRSGVVDGQLEPADSVDSLRFPFSTNWDNGHTFTTTKDTVRLTHNEYYARNLSGSAWFRGALLPQIPNSPLWFGYPSLPSWDSTQMGTSFINQTIPTKPQAQTLITLGEAIKDGIPRLPGIMTLRDKTDVARKAGSEYLNVVFGWMPLVADLRRILRSVILSNELIAQFERDSGRNVRRRRTIEPVTTLEDFGVLGNKTLHNNPFNENVAANSIFRQKGSNPAHSYDSGPLQKMRTTTVEYSFSAAYTYYLETGGDILADIKAYSQKANYLLGTKLTPSVLWELAPWSWLVDWYANIGTLLSNNAAFSSDSLVMRYGYVMRHVTVTDTYLLTGIEFWSSNPGPIGVVVSRKRKERVRGTPYGFGLNPNQFTGRQWAILAALGLTRSPGSLRWT